MIFVMWFIRRNYTWWLSPNLNSQSSSSLTNQHGNCSLIYLTCGVLIITTASPYLEKYILNLNSDITNCNLIHCIQKSDPLCRDCCWIHQWHVNIDANVLHVLWPGWQGCMAIQIQPMKWRKRKDEKIGRKEKGVYKVKGIERKKRMIRKRHIRMLWHHVEVVGVLFLFLFLVF